MHEPDTRIQCQLPCWLISWVGYPINDSNPAFRSCRFLFYSYTVHFIDIHTMQLHGFSDVNFTIAMLNDWADFDKEKLRKWQQWQKQKKAHIIHTLLKCRLDPYYLLYLLSSTLQAFLLGQKDMDLELVTPSWLQNTWTGNPDWCGWNQSTKQAALVALIWYKGHNGFLIIKPFAAVCLSVSNTKVK